MPGSGGGASVVAANPTTVMPFSLCRAFRRSQSWAVEANHYQNGELQTRSLVSTSRKRWNLEKHLVAADVGELRAFYLSQGGGLIEFTFYDVYETDPLFNYDETGTDVDGRYAVRFDGPWDQALVMGLMADVQLVLVEVS